MTTFDGIIPELTEIFRSQTDKALPKPIMVNRDLNGRVRLIVDEKHEGDEHASKALYDLAQTIAEKLGPHAFPAKQALLFEPDFEQSLGLEHKFQLDDIDGIYVVDRLTTESDWSSIELSTTEVPRIVFFSIKGGVGRSTALAAAAWSLAESGKRVLVLDLDLESPGLSSSILPEDRRPAYGIADWLVEDLVDNGSAMLNGMVATSVLSHNGEIYVVPAHGADAGEYIAKLGRVWMPKMRADGREPWAKRLQRLLDELEERVKPDITLIDSRAGIDDVASACIIGLSASTILLFAIDGDQTWAGYRILFRHWRTTGVVRKIRERLQLVGAMIPEIGKEDYFAGLRERAWDAFSEELYDEIEPGKLADGEVWSFDEADESAPHFPLPVRWNRGFAALQSLHEKFDGIDEAEVQSIFGAVIDSIITATTQKGEK